MSNQLLWNLCTYTAATFIASVAAWQYTGSKWAGVCLFAGVEALHYLLAFQLTKTAEQSQAAADAAADRAQAFIVSEGAKGMTAQQHAGGNVRAYPERTATAIRQFRGGDS